MDRTRNFIIMISLCVQYVFAASTNTPSSSTSGSTTTQMNDVTNSSATAATQTSTQLPVSTTVAPSRCPRYSMEYINNVLIIPYQNGECKMVVKTETFVLRFPGLEELFGQTIKKQQKKLHRPVVSVGRLESNSSTAESNTTCKIPDMRKIGPFVFVDTVPGKCQILLAVKRFGKLSEEIRNLPGVMKRTKGLKRKRIPVYEYLDEILF